MENINIYKILESKIIESFFYDYNEVMRYPKENKKKFSINSNFSYEASSTKGVINCYLKINLKDDTLIQFVERSEIKNTVTLSICVKAKVFINDEYYKIEDNKIEIKEEIIKAIERDITKELLCTTRIMCSIYSYGTLNLH